MRPAGVRVIGLTGGIASGKTSVARFFQGRGAVVIDADQLARSAVQPGSRGLERVVAAFGADILTPDGQLDRKRLGALVFSDTDKRARLEGIVHPEIKRLAEDRIRQAADHGEKLVFYVAPLLIEAGITDRVDEVWVVTVQPEVQLERLMRRDGIARDEALRVIASQMPLAEKATYGKIVIDNSGTPQETASLLAEIWAREIEGGHE
ncbi:MAG: dephospho-CoA kinase [Geobacteraceae bacterium]|nr:dephospho-CoA kinase [Geobacteraceae bacterium]